MASPLIAGGNVSLTRENPDLTTIVVGFGWDSVKSNGPITEIVPSAVLCGSDGKAINPKSLVFFNQTLSDDGTVEFVSDNDDEQMEVDIAFVPSEIHKIAFVVYVNPEERRPGNFASIRSAYIRIAKKGAGELVRFNIPSASLSSTVDAMIFGELYRYKEEWKFRAVGQGYSTGLKGVASDFRVDI